MGILKIESFFLENIVFSFLLNGRVSLKRLLFLVFLVRLVVCVNVKGNGISVC